MKNITIDQAILCRFADQLLEDEKRPATIEKYACNRKKRAQIIGYGVR